MSSRTCRLAALLAALVPAAATAGSVEITPFYSFLDGGEIEGDGAPNTDLDSDADFGLAVAFPYAPGVKIEALVARYDSAIRIEDGGPRTAQLDVTYLHLGGLWEWGEGPGKTFATASAGVAWLDPEGRSPSSESLPSLGLGGGGKYFFHDHVGVRLEGRIFANVVGGSRRVFCSGSSCVGRVTGSFLWQFQAAAGLVLRID